MKLNKSVVGIISFIIICTIFAACGHNKTKAEKITDAWAQMVSLQGEIVEKIKALPSELQNEFADMVNDISEEINALAATLEEKGGFSKVSNDKLDETSARIEQFVMQLEDVKSDVENSDLISEFTYGEDETSGEEVSIES